MYPNQRHKVQKYDKAFLEDAKPKTHSSKIDIPEFPPEMNKKVYKRMVSLQDLYSRVPGDLLVVFDLHRYRLFS